MLMMVLFSLLFHQMTKFRHWVMDLNQKSSTGDYSLENPLTIDKNHLKWLLIPDGKMSWNMSIALDPEVGIAQRCHQMWRPLIVWELCPPTGPWTMMMTWLNSSLLTHPLKMRILDLSRIMLNPSMCLLFLWVSSSASTVWFYISDFFLQWPAVFCMLSALFSLNFQFLCGNVYEWVKRMQPFYLAGSNPKTNLCVICFMWLVSNWCDFAIMSSYQFWHANSLLWY